MNKQLVPMLYNNNNRNMSLDKKVFNEKQSNEIQTRSSRDYNEKKELHEINNRLDLYINAVGLINFFFILFIAQRYFIDHG